MRDQEQAILCTFRPCPGCGTPIMVRLNSPAPFCPMCGADKQPMGRQIPALRLERESRRKRMALAVTVSALYWVFIDAFLDWQHATVGVVCIWLLIGMKERRLRGLARSL